MHFTILQYLGTALASILAFGGQQIGKQEEFNRQQLASLEAGVLNACKDPDIKQCQPLNDYYDMRINNLIKLKAYPIKTKPPSHAPSQQIDPDVLTKTIE